MGRVRSFVQNDIPQVADLYQKVFGPIYQKNGRKASDATVRPSSPSLKAYFNEVFFQNPGYDPELPSLVYEKDDGRVVGFAGVIPRRMSMKGKPIRAAVCTQLMVEPGSRTMLAGLELLKALFSGPQDLSLTDGANASARQIWERCGGVTIPIYSIVWTRILRPSRYALDSLGEKHRFLRPFVFGSRIFCWTADSITAQIRPNRFRRGRLSFSQEDLDTKTLFENLPKFSSAVSLRPDYDLASLQWLLEMAEQKKQWGALRKEALRNAAREIVGWYLYYLKSGGMSRVIQIAASPKSVSHVLDHLFYSAWRQGATAISGRLEPKYLHELSHQYCRFTETCSAFLVQSHSQDILQAVYTGDAFLSRLEGEWWNRFGELVQ